MEEFMFLGLRLKRGVSFAEFEMRFKRKIEDVYGSVVDDFIAEKLLVSKNGRIYLSQKGMDVANYVMAEFILE